MLPGEVSRRLPRRLIILYYRDLEKAEWRRLIWLGNLVLAPYGGHMDEPSDWSEDCEDDAYYEEFKRKFFAGEWKGHLTPDMPGVEAFLPTADNNENDPRLIRNGPDPNQPFAKELTDLLKTHGKAKNDG